MPTRYLDPKIDLAFKRVFGEHADLLKSFLNALLPLPEDAPIESLTYLTPEQAPEIPGLLKNSIVDVKCRDVKGHTFIVEMQMLWSPLFQNRMVFGGAQAFVKQLKKGQDYRSLQPVYALALIDDVFDDKTPNFYHHYQIVNLENTHETLKGLEFVFIELPKFKPESRTDRRMQALWLRFLNEVGEEGVVPDEEMTGDADIASALGLVEVAAFTEAELEAYHTDLDHRRIETSLLGDAEAKGMEKGLLEGIAQLVRTMSANGMQVGQISQMTQLPVAQVQQMLS
jgi:predicted transposase/invertase (TIGR01784 family)